MAKTISNKRQIIEKSIENQERYLKQDIATIQGDDFTDLKHLKQQLLNMVEAVNELEKLHSKQILLTEILLSDYELK